LDKKKKATGATMRANFFTALAIAILFFVSALAKWYFPSNLPLHLDQIAATFEVVAALLVLLLFRKAWVWAALTVLFSLWLGYSLFWFIRHESCGCFGNVLPLSAGITATVDAIVIGLSFWNWGKIESAQPKKKMLFVLIDGLIMVIGFLIAVTISWMKPEFQQESHQQDRAFPGES
jgi:hypothetical protein